jgi:hypothetical protein
MQCQAARGVVRTLGDEEAPADNDDTTDPCTYPPPISAVCMLAGFASSQSAL